MRRADIMHAVIEDSSDEIEFLKNLAVMTDVLVERDHPDAGYFGEITKHMIGRHHQKDHDPTKGKGHRRGQHRELTQQIRRGSTKAHEQYFPGGARNQFADAAAITAMGFGAAAVPLAVPGIARYGLNLSNWAKGSRSIKNIPTPVTTQGVRNIKRTRETAQSSLRQARQRYEQMLAQHRSRPRVFTGDMPTNTVNFGQAGNVPFGSRPNFLPALVRPRGFE